MEKQDVTIQLELVMHEWRDIGNSQHAICMVLMVVMGMCLGGCPDVVCGGKLLKNFNPCHA